MIEKQELTKEQNDTIINILEYFEEYFDDALELYLDYQYDNNEHYTEGYLNPYWWVSKYLFNYNYTLYIKYNKLEYDIHTDLILEILELLGIEDADEINIEDIKKVLNIIDIKRQRKQKLQKLEVGK